jgi:hypothetical protein
MELPAAQILPRISGERGIFRVYYALLLISQGLLENVLQAHTDAYQCSPLVKFVADEYSSGSWAQVANEVTKLDHRQFRMLTLTYSV